MQIHGVPRGGLVLTGTFQETRLRLLSVVLGPLLTFVRFQDPHQRRSSSFKKCACNFGFLPPGGGGAEPPAGPRRPWQVPRLRSLCPVPPRCLSPVNTGRALGAQDSVRGGDRTRSPGQAQDLQGPGLLSPRWGPQPTARAQRQPPGAAPVHEFMDSEHASLTLPIASKLCPTNWLDCEPETLKSTKSKSQTKGSEGSPRGPSR